MIAEKLPKDLPSLEELESEFLEKLSSLPEGLKEQILYKVLREIKRKGFFPSEDEDRPEIFEECIQGYRKDCFSLSGKEGRVFASTQAALKLLKHLEGGGDVLEAAQVINSGVIPTFKIPEWAEVITRVRGELRGPEYYSLYNKLEKQLRLLFGHYCGDCGKVYHQDYMVKSSTWEESASKSNEVLHLECLEKRLGRGLTIEDFIEAPINETFRFAYKRGTEEG